MDALRETEAVDGASVSVLVRLSSAERILVNSDDSLSPSARFCAVLRSSSVCE